MIIGARACAEAPPDGYTLCVMPGEPLTYNQFHPEEPALRSGEELRADHQLLLPHPGARRQLEARRQDARRARRLFEGEGRHAVLFGAVVVADRVHGEVEAEDRRRPGAGAVQGRRRHRHQHALGRDAGRLPRARQPALLHPRRHDHGRSWSTATSARRSSRTPRRSARSASRATTRARSSACSRPPARRAPSSTACARRSSKIASEPTSEADDRPRARAGAQHAEEFRDTCRRPRAVGRRSSRRRAWRREVREAWRGARRSTRIDRGRQPLERERRIAVCACGNKCAAERHARIEVVEQRAQPRHRSARSSARRHRRSRRLAAGFAGLDARCMRRSRRQLARGAGFGVLGGVASPALRDARIGHDPDAGDGRSALFGRGRQAASIAWSSRRDSADAPAQATAQRG